MNGKEKHVINQMIKDELDEAISDYGKNYDDVVDQMNKDLDELNKKSVV